MKTPICLYLIFLSILLTFYVAEAQKKTKKDTLYYYIDLKKIPINDRMISLDTEMVYHFYQIDCPCYNLNAKPRFIRLEKQAFKLRKSELHLIKFISLPGLITLIKANDYETFRRRYILYFVSPGRKDFVREELILQEELKHQVAY